MGVLKDDFYTQILPLWNDMTGIELKKYLASIHEPRFAPSRYQTLHVMDAEDLSQLKDEKKLSAIPKNEEGNISVFVKVKDSWPLRYVLDAICRSQIDEHKPGHLSTVGFCAVLGCISQAHVNLQKGARGEKNSYMKQHDILRAVQGFRARVWRKNDFKNLMTKLGEKSEYKASDLDSKMWIDDKATGIPLDGHEGAFELITECLSCSFAQSQWSGLTNESLEKAAQAEARKMMENPKYAQQPVIKVRTPP